MPKAKAEKRYIKRGEPLAIKPEAIRREGPGAFFFLFGPAVAPNERVGDGDRIAVVNVRGPLDQFADCWGENYESIVNRVRDAMTGADVERGEAVDSDRSDPPAAEKPDAVVLRISSPGGVVAGLNETVRKLRALRAEHDVPLVAYVDEMAASAAYALACACDDIYLPASGVVGSIGVISHMFSVARANDEDGIDVEVIASGEFKTDNNENLPIEEGAIGRERARVMKLAGQFWSLVADARGLSPKTVAGFEAGIFLGEDSVEAGLADAVLPWDAFLDEMALAHSGTAVTHSDTQAVPRGTTAQGASDMSRLKALIAQTKKDLASATGARRKELGDKLARLNASLADLDAWYKKTKTTEESEEKDDAEDDEDAEADEDAEDDEPDKDDDKAEDDAEERKGEDEESDEDAEDDSDEKKCGDEGADDEAMLSAMLSGVKGKQRAQLKGKLAALMADAKAGRQAAADVRKMARARDREQLATLVDKKLAGHFVTKSEATWLKKQPRATVESFLATRKHPVLRTEDTRDVPKDNGRPDMAAHVSEAEFAMIERAWLASGQRVSLEKMVEDYKSGSHKPNGVKGAA